MYSTGKKCKQLYNSNFLQCYSAPLKEELDNTCMYIKNVWKSSGYFKI
jgi:hypothetical protein